MRRLSILFAVFAAFSSGACHHDAATPIEPAGPGEKPPLPPASGTPIGFLLDDSELKLSEAQTGKLREIDTSLAAELEKIDAQTRAANRPADDGSSAPPPPSSGGGRHGGRGGGGMGGGGMGGGGGGGRHHKSGGAGAGSGSPGGAAVAGRLADLRNADVKDALTRAFAVLDPTQQDAAKKVLSEHDVDVDVDVAAPAPNRLPSPSEQAGEAEPPTEP